jgi:hypothetical protein
MPMRILPSFRRLAVCTLLLFACGVEVSPDTKVPVPFARRRALLVGIDDYSASSLHGKRGESAAVDRIWPELRGSVRDVESIREMLLLRYGFRETDIVMLTNQAATRVAILDALERHLIAPAGKGDVLLFYFSGHGSQVPNRLSHELDKLDESIVPADSRLGAPDIRDKELGARFNQILDRGARLTVILDSCHSGSGARGLSAGAVARGIKADTREVADGSTPALPEDRGALVLSATQDFGRAYETVDEQGKYHGVFSWAWLRALRDAAPGEPSADTFLRAQALIRAESAYQDPVIGGNTSAQLTPFLGIQQQRQAGHTIVAVQSFNPNGTVTLQGGWAHGLSVGTELRPVGNHAAEVLVEVTTLLGLGRSEGRIVRGAARWGPQPLQSGTLLEVVSWSVPPGRPLRVWAPHAGSIEPFVVLARQLAKDATRTKVRWISDPTDSAPTHVLRWRDNAWELVAPGMPVKQLGRAIDSRSVMEKLPADASLFVQLPASTPLVEEIGVGQGTQHDGVQLIDRPEDADYLLVGRLTATGVEYSWIRPLAQKEDSHRTALPPGTDWQSPVELTDAGLVLRHAILELRKILAWHLLQSPPDSASPYRLTLLRASDNTVPVDQKLIGGEKYRLVLRAAAGSVHPGLKRRYFYVFGIDSFGKSVLLFPRGGSENRFPIQPVEDVPPIEIPMASFTATAPYGLDTYILLSSDELLPNPSILEWMGVRTRGPKGTTALEELLSRTGGSSRSMAPLAIPAIWSIEKVLAESVPPGRNLP